MKVSCLVSQKERKNITMWTRINISFAFAKHLPPAVPALLSEDFLALCWVCTDAGVDGPTKQGPASTN